MKSLAILIKASLRKKKPLMYSNMKTMRDEFTLSQMLQGCENTVLITNGKPNRATHIYHLLFCREPLNSEHVKVSNVLLM